MTDNKYPFAPGLTLEQARECAQKIQDQYSQQIKEAKNIENRLGTNHSFPEYLSA